MDRLLAALDEAIVKVKIAINGEPKSPVELLLDQYLPLHDEVVSFSPKNCCAVAIPTFALNDLASRTNNIVDYPFIMGRIWDIMLDSQHDPSLMKKVRSRGLTCYEPVVGFLKRWYFAIRRLSICCITC